MAAALLRFVLWTISSLAGLLSFLVFRAAALLVVSLIHLFKLPRQVSSGAVEFVADFIRSASEQVLQLLKDLLVSVASGLLEVLANAVAGSFQLAASGAAELAESARSRLAAVSEVLPEVAQGAVDVLVKVAESVWSGYKDAVGYVMENA